MNRIFDENKIYEVAFNTIKDSLDLANNLEKQGGYSNYIEGVVDMVDDFLRELNGKSTDCDVNNE